MNVPERRVLENHIRNNNVSGIYDFNEIWSSELKGSLPPHVPPDFSLAVNCPILTYAQTNLSDSLGIEIVNNFTKQYRYSFIWIMKHHRSMGCDFLEC